MKRLRRDLFSTTAWSTGLLVLMAGMQAEPAWAQAAAKGSVTPTVTAGVVHFSIPAGPASTALAAFGQAAKLQILYPASMTQGVTSPGVRGNYTPQQALAQILADTGLSYRFTDTKTVTLIPAPQGNADSVTLPAVVVAGNTTSPYPTDPYATMVNPLTTVGSKIPVSAKEIPQTVNVITQKQIQQQNMRTTDDALRYVPGVTVMNAGQNTSAYYSRGFPITTYQLDGVPTAVPSYWGVNSASMLAMYDRVEVLQGPAGLFNGFGGDGGVINFVRKRAPSQFQSSVDLSGGTYDNFAGTVDVGGPLNKNGTIRGRFVASDHYQHLMQDGTWQNDKQFYGTIEADLTPKTTLRVGASYTETDGRVMYGLPAYSNYKLLNLSRSTYVGAPWNHMNQSTTDVFAELDQKLGGDWKARIGYDHSQNNQSALAGIAGSPVDASTGIADLYSFNYKDSNRQDSIDANITGPLRVFGRTHWFTFGGSYTHQNEQFYRYEINSNTGLDGLGDVYTNLTNNTAYSNAFAGGKQADQTNLTTQYGLYGNARISLLKPLTLVLGARVSWWNSTIIPNSNPDYNFFGVTYTKESLGPKFSPIIGLVYDIDKTYSLYGSYSSIYVPQSGTTVTGALIAPISGTQYEAGVKATYFGGRMNASAALFQITESNVETSDPNNPGYYLAQGRQRSRGIQLQVNGEILRGWTVSTGYTYLLTKQLSSDLEASSDPFTETSPRHVFKLLTDYQMQGRFSKIGVGGSIYATTGTSYSDGTGRWKAPGYVTLGAHVSYHVTPKVTATLSAINLLNEKYWQTVSSSGNYYGPPRTVLMSLHTVF